MIRTEGLTKYFEMGRDRFLHAVDGVSLTIQSNEILGLVGESGSGKSTFGKTLIGLHERTAGEAFLNDVPLPAKFSAADHLTFCLLYTSPSPRDGLLSRMPSSA